MTAMDDKKLFKKITERCCSSGPGRGNSAKMTELTEKTLL